MASLAEIYNWFMTSKKPTQAQFWASWGSFWNKEEQIPQSAITGLPAVLNAKTENDQFNAHKVAADAHAALFDLKVDKDGTKVLSDQNFTLSEKQKLDYIDQTKDVDKPVSTPQATADATVLTTAQTYSDSVIDQLKGGVSLNYDTLKKLADELTAVRAIVGGTTADADNIINTVAELMAVLSTYPEGTDLFALVQAKVAKTDIYNALDCIVSGKVADARQLKVLNDLITTLNSNLALKEDVANKSNSILDLESEVKFPVWKAIKNWCVSQFKNVLLGIKTVPDLTYSLISTDNTKRLLFTNANPVTATIPTNAITAIPVGSKIEYTQQGNGVVTVGGAGVTILTNLSLTSVKGETRILTKIDVDTWTLSGNVIYEPNNVPVFNDTTTFINRYNALGNNKTATEFIYNTADSPIPYYGLYVVTLVKWLSNGSFGSIMAVNTEPGTGQVYTKTIYNGVWGGWREIGSSATISEYIAKIDTTTGVVSVLYDGIGAVTVTRPYNYAFNIVSPNIINTSKILVSATLDSNANITDNRSIDYKTNNNNDGTVTLILRENNVIKNYTVSGVMINITLKVIK